MRVIKIEPKDIYVTLELSITEVSRLLDFFDIAKSESKDEKGDQANRYITEEFWPILKEIEGSTK